MQLSTETLSLQDTFGYCIIPKNTTLYRGYKDAEHCESMFFGLRACVARIFNHEEIQIWKTKEDVNILFLVEHVDEGSWVTSSLPRLFNLLFENSYSETDDLGIKYWIKENGNILYNDFNIRGFFTSLENKIETEVCLLNTKENFNQLKFIETIKAADLDNYYKNSLRQLKLFPAKSFYEQTKIKLNEHFSFDRIKDPYKRHLKYYRGIINYEAKTPGEIERAKEEYYDLRLKLKV